MCEIKQNVCVKIVKQNKVKREWYYPILKSKLLGMKIKKLYWKVREKNKVEKIKKE